MTDLVPQAVRDLLVFYTEHYPEVRFADLDISVLKHAVESIDAAAKALTIAEEAAAQAREQFQNSEAELSVKARRTLSFLKIHVEGNEVQLAKLEAISMAMTAARRKSKASADVPSGMGEPRKRRTRKSKDSADTISDLLSNPDSALEATSERAVTSASELSDPGSDEPSSAPKADKKKTGSKSAAVE